MVLTRCCIFVLSVYSCIHMGRMFFVLDRSVHFRFESDPLIYVLEPKGFNFTFLGQVGWRSVWIYMRLNKPFYKLSDEPDLSFEFNRSLLPNFTYMWFLKDETWALCTRDVIYFHIKAERGDGSLSAIWNNSIQIKNEFVPIHI